MTKEFVPYELASKLIYELGFKEKCLATIDQIGCLHIKGNKLSTKGSMLYDIVDCPTFSQAFRWFRENYGLDSFCRQTTLDGRSYFKISKIETDEIIKGYSFFSKTYEEAELACLDKLIEILETKKQEQ